MWHSYFFGERTVRNQHHGIYSLLIAAILALCVSVSSLGAQTRLLNVSYDPTREFYEQYNKLFAQHWKATTGQNVVINQSHGGSGKQARSVIDGLEADVVTLALGYDIDAIAAKSGLIDKNWQSKLPYNSTPYTSTVVFLVRKGTPRGIRDWNDLIRSGIRVITPNPKTSGGARWNYLAAWGYALRTSGNNEQGVREYMRKLFQNVPVLDSGARGATITFAQRGVGDVLIAWENEALLARKQFGPDKFEIVMPHSTILTEPPVAVVDKVARKHGTEKVAHAYLEYLYSPEAQELAARYFYRPRLKAVADKYASSFPRANVFTVNQGCGGWQNAQAKHFSDGGTFDQVYGQ
jgi:sulfate transport system substrate-binding protein